MNAKILSFINKCEKWKVEIKENHWAANSLSQHELCDDIASAISDFEDLVSEVEQSISGKFKNGELRPDKAEKIGLKAFVEEVISSSKEFLKELEGMGDEYVGIKSECETFIGTMQRNLYLVNFTLKEELKSRLRLNLLSEAMPKNPLNVEDDDFDRFIGRRPKTMKSRINQIYKIVKKYGIDSRLYHDEGWQAIEDYYRAISSLGCEVDMKPCADLSNRESMMSDGGYTDYDENDHMARSKQYAIRITFDDGMVVDGYVKCMAAGTVEDPFSAYDTCMVLWPKSNRVLEGKGIKQVRLSESELRQVVKEATIKILSETPLNYDIDNFSGKWTKNAPDDYVDPEGYLDNPNDHNDVEYELWKDAWEGNDGKTPKDLENEYSWNAFDRQAVAPGVDGYYSIMKSGVPSEVDKALSRNNKDKDWGERELKQRDRMMGKWIDGKRDADEIGDAWEDLHYEGKKPLKVTESELKDLVREAAIKVIREGGINIKPSKEGTFTAAAKKHGKSVQGFASQVLNNKDEYSPAMVKKANFARNAKKWKKG